MSPARRRPRHPGLLALSIVLAIIVWLYVHAVLSGEGVRIAYKDIKGITVSLLGEEKMLGRNLMVVDLEQPAVDVRIRGPEQELEKLTAFDLIAFVNIRGLKPGKAYSLPVKVVLPRNVDMVGAPSLVRVEIKDQTL